jgi:predicted phosphodiesterase
MKKAFICFAVVLLLSCANDIQKNFIKEEIQKDFYDSYTKESANERFIENQNYPEVVKPNIIDENNYSFIVCSDFHYGVNEKRMFFSEIENNKQNAEFCIITGDICNSSADNEWMLYKKDKNNISIPVYATIGNHDVRYHRGANFLQSTNRSVYSFEINNTLFIIVDSASQQYGDLQLQWIDNVLNNTTCQNKILFTHMDDVQSGIELLEICNNHSITLVCKGDRHLYLDKQIGVTRFITINSIDKKLTNDIDATHRLLKVNIVNSIINLEWLL